MTRARLLVALLLVAVLAVPAAAQLPCAGPSITFTQAPVVVQAERTVRLQGLVVAQDCVPAQKAPVTLRMMRPSAPGTNWTRVTRTDKWGYFSFALKVPEAGVVLTVAVPLLDKTSGLLVGTVQRSVGPLLFTHRLALTGRPKTNAGRAMRLHLRTTEALCAQTSATYTVETRPAGGAWQDPQVVSCAKRFTPLGGVLAPVPGDYPPWAPLLQKDFQFRAVRHPAGPYELPSVSPPLDVCVRSAPDGC